MEELHRIIQVLDKLPNYQARKEYLESICNKSSVEKNDLRKIASKVLLENNFIRSYYKDHLSTSFKIKIEKILIYFINTLKKVSNIRPLLQFRFMTLKNRKYDKS